MTTPDISVRAATEDDAARLAEIHVAAWRATYRGVMTDQYLDGFDGFDGLDVGRAASAWRRNIREPREGTRHLVVQGGNEVTGFAILGPASETRQRAPVSSTRSMCIRTGGRRAQAPPCLPPPNSS